MNWRWWLSAIVIALLVTATTFCIRSIWTTEWISYARAPHVVQAADGSGPALKREELGLFSSNGQLTWMRMTHDQADNGAPPSSHFSTASVPRSSPGWKWINVKNARNWSVFGFGMNSGSAPFSFFAVAIPYWAVIGVLAAMLLILIRSGRAQRRLKKRLCPKCAYDIREEFDKGCPECGWNRQATASPPGA